MCISKKKVLLIVFFTVCSLTLALFFGSGVSEAQTYRWKQISNWVGVEGGDFRVYAGGYKIFVYRKGSSINIEHKHIYMYNGTPFSWKKIQLPSDCLSSDWRFTTDSFTIDKDTGKLYCKCHMGKRIYIWVPAHRADADSKDDVSPIKKGDLIPEKWRLIYDRENKTFCNDATYDVSIYAGGNRLVARADVRGNIPSLRAGHANEEFRLFEYVGNFRFPKTWRRINCSRVMSNYSTYPIDTHLYWNAKITIDSDGDIFGAFLEEGSVDIHPSHRIVFKYNQTNSTWSEVYAKVFKNLKMSAGGNLLYMKSATDNDDDVSWIHLNLGHNYTTSIGTVPSSSPLIVGSDGTLYTKDFNGLYKKHVPGTGGGWQPMNGPPGPTPASMNLSLIEEVYAGNNLYVVYDGNIWERHEMKSMKPIIKDDIYKPLKKEEKKPSTLTQPFKMEMERK